MSKSLKRVQTYLERLGLPVDIVETGPAKTAALAADAVSCEIDQIAKSIIMQGQESGALYLFVTAGAQQVSPHHATTLAGEPLGKADAAIIRRVTGFAIGGVSPVGHLTPIRTYFDRTLLAFDCVYAAAGTPNHVFSVNPDDLCTAIGGEITDFIA